MKEKNKKKQIIASVVAVLLLVLLTIGVTYAVFTYTKLGTTENTVTAGTLKFLYTENTGVGAGIALTDALPVSDSVGKAYSTEGKVFDFSIEATNTGTGVIPYEVTLRKKSDSTLGEEAVKVYLTDMTEDADSELLAPTLYSNLVQTEIEVGDEIEKTIYTDNVPGGEEEYKKDYRLRLWVGQETDFSTGNYNGKTFTATVNVYSNVPLVSDEELNLRNNAEISSAQVGDTELTKVEGQSYQYEASVPEGTTETTINVETENPNSTVTIEKVDSLAYNNSSINRMAVSKTVSLTDGDNYFKVTVLSENKKVEKEYGVKISIVKPIALQTAIFEKYTTINENPNLTLSSSNDAPGLYKSTDTNSGNPTYYFRTRNAGPGYFIDNYIKFAGFTWRIVRINEDGTIRIAMEDGINDNEGYFITNSIDKMQYYSNSVGKTLLENWYDVNIVNKGYGDYVSKGDYFCEEAKVKYSDSYTSDNANMTLYTSYNTPSFKCESDGNGKGIVNASIGLITYDEVRHSEIGYSGRNAVYKYGWTMSHAGLDSESVASSWGPNNYWISAYNSAVSGGDPISMNYTTYNKYILVPVVNLKADIMVTGSGTSDSHWVVQ